MITLPSAQVLASVGWPLTVWTQARQVTTLLGWSAMSGDEVAPNVFFATLRAAGRDVEAAQFLGLSLPRYEAVAWAARALANHLTPEPEDAEAMRAVHDWLREPSDPLRRAAAATADTIREATPAKLCATAVSLSGGSLTPVGDPPIPAPRHATGILAAAAVLAAAFATAGPEINLAEALDLGAAIAAHSTGALS